LEKLYEQMDFILSGGALKLLVDFLTPKVKTALITQSDNADLEILDAIGVQAEELILRGWSSKAAAAFPKRSVSGKFEVSQAPFNQPLFDEEWSWIVRIRGLHWNFYIFLQEKADDALIRELKPFAGFLSLWQDRRQVEEVDNRLSRLSYTILATKNTLAAIFEPMPLGYYAAFLTDVLRESLFPYSVAIFRDDGRSLSLLEGDKRTPPAREGIYAQKILSATPAFTREESAPYEMVMPIADESERLFCVTEWDKKPVDETLNFMELIGELARCALSIYHLRAESGEKRRRISSESFTIFSLAQGMTALSEQTNRQSFFLMAADIFREISKAGECFLVVWDKEKAGYVPAACLKQDLPASFEPVLLPASPIRKEQKERKFFFDLKKTDISELMAPPWPEMSAMRYLFPFWCDDLLAGFMALSSESDSPLDESRLAALRITAQISALVLRKLPE
jgi:hypothetical protein